MYEQERPSDRHPDGHKTKHQRHISIPYQGHTMHAPVAPFPVHILPSPLAAMVQETAEALPCPPDFVAVPILALLGAAIGTRRVVQIKLGWKESPTIWVAVIGDPGSKKSPALDLVMKPFHKRQRELEERYNQELAAYKAAKASKKKGEPDEDDPEPIMEQIFTTDSTVEAFAALLQQNPRGLAFVCDELTAWARAMNQYKGGKGSDRQSWLSFWNGAQVIVNRLRRKEPIIIQPFRMRCWLFTS